jgi:hypothetical protein
VKNEHKYEAMNNVFESLEETFRFGKFKGYSLKEVYCGNNTIEPSLLYAYLKSLIDSDDPSLMLPQYPSIKLAVKEINEHQIEFGYPDGGTVLKAVRESAEFKRHGPNFEENLICQLIFNKVNGDIIGLHDGNFNIIKFALTEYPDAVKLPGESASAIAWYIKKISNFCINPDLLSSLQTHYVYELIAVKLRRFSGLRFTYEPVFKREQRTFSQEIIEENKRKYKLKNQTGQSAESDGSSYTRYQGSYASDQMGFSDQDIDDVFDGDPDAYWNID